MQNSDKTRNKSQIINLLQSNISYLRDACDNSNPGLLSRLYNNLGGEFLLEDPVTTENFLKEAIEKDDPETKKDSQKINPNLDQWCAARQRFIRGLIFTEYGTLIDGFDDEFKSLINRAYNQFGQIFVDGYLVKAYVSAHALAISTNIQKPVANNVQTSRLIDEPPTLFSDYKNQYGEIQAYAAAIVYVEASNTRAHIEYIERKEGAAVANQIALDPGQLQKELLQINQAAIESVTYIEKNKKSIIDKIDKLDAKLKKFPSLEYNKRPLTKAEHDKKMKLDEKKNLYNRKYNIMEYISQQIEEIKGSTDLSVGRKLQSNYPLVAKKCSTLNAYLNSEDVKNQLQKHDNRALSFINKTSNYNILLKFINLVLNLFIKTRSEKSVANFKGAFFNPIVNSLIIQSNQISVKENPEVNNKHSVSCNY